jgi:hypothetical protein
MCTAGISLRKIPYEKPSDVASDKLRQHGKLVPERTAKFNDTTIVSFIKHLQKSGHGKYTSMNDRNLKLQFGVIFVAPRHLRHDVLAHQRGVALNSCENFPSSRAKTLHPIDRSCPLKSQLSSGSCLFQPFSYQMLNCKRTLHGEGGMLAKS